MRLWRMLACWVVFALPAAADEAAIEAAWRAWVADTEVTQSTLAISKNGEVVAAYGIGTDADAPVLLASLSKAITGACIIDLIDDGALRFDTTLAEAFAARPDLLGNGAQITIAQLLTHTSGLDFDRTQSLFNPSFWGGPDLHDRITGLALGQRPDAEGFAYNNENYAILGSVIMEITGQSVAQACAARALPGLQTAAPHGRVGGSLAWAGWEMSVADYARFAATLQPRADWPTANVRGRTYGPGVFVEQSEDGVELWHDGLFCINFVGGDGALFRAFNNGWSVVVAYDICGTDWDARRLDRVMERAAYGSD